MMNQLIANIEINLRDETFPLPFVLIQKEQKIKNRKMLLPAPENG